MSAPTTSQKTPVHSAVAVICDILTPLSNEERTRAMEAIAASLGIVNPVAQKTSGRAPSTGLPLVSASAALGATALAPVPAPAVRPVGMATPRSYRGANGSSVTIAAPRGIRSVDQGDVNRVVLVGAQQPSPTASTPRTSFRYR